jgi:DNA modification methylase
MKPVELIHRHLSNSTDPGEVVVDPFAGSGSTLIACHQLTRVARLAEVDAKYADVICRRFQEHTGTIPTRGGVPHDFIAVADDDEISEAAGS